jgi:hypothetical protein
MTSPPDEIQALEMYELAVALVKTNGVSLTLGVIPFKEYRTGSVTIHYLPRSGHLDVWYGRKVLTIDRWKGPPQVVRYVPGHWEDELATAAAKSLSKA